MIADLDETIRQLLIAELPVKNGEIEINFHQPKREWSARLSKPTVNFFLYDLRENVILRQHQWERLPGGNGDGLARLKRTPFRVDCYYMLTTWAAEPDDEHRLLTRSMLALFKFPFLPDDRLIGSLKNPAFEIQARLAAHDKLTNPAELWSSLDNEIRPSISYVVTLALDPWKEITGPIVRTLTMRSGQAVSLPRKKKMTETTLNKEVFFIGGVVRSKSQGNAPVEGVEVTVEGTGFASHTNAEGRYVLSGLLSGDYTLVVISPDGKPKEKKIVLPYKEGDYDIEIG